jgi:deoxycytidine triphosphate deaminase
MNLIDGEHAAERLDGIVHAPSQVQKDGVDLTVGQVFRFETAGQLDFGGGEFEAAEATRLEPELKDPDDDYGWWELEGGVYRIRFNETVDTDSSDVVRMQPLPRLLACGVTHPTREWTGAEGTLEAVVHVPPCGVGLKENFRATRFQVRTREFLD